MNPTKENERNEYLDKVLINMLEESGEHGLCVADILSSYINHVLLDEEREIIIDSIAEEK